MLVVGLCLGTCILPCKQTTLFCITIVPPLPGKDHPATKAHLSTRVQSYFSIPLSVTISKQHHTGRSKSATAAVAEQATPIFYPIGPRSSAEDTSLEWSCLTLYCQLLSSTLYFLFKISENSHNFPPLKHRQTCKGLAGHRGRCVANSTPSPPKKQRQFSRGNRFA